MITSATPTQKAHRIPMLTTFLEILRDILTAYRKVRAEQAARDTAKTQPLVDHADTAATDVAAELKRGSTPTLPN